MLVIHLLCTLIVDSSYTTKYYTHSIVHVCSIIGDLHIILTLLHFNAVLLCCKGYSLQAHQLDQEVENLLAKIAEYVEVIENVSSLV